VAIIIRGKTTCSICRAVLANDDDIVATPHFIHDESHKLWRFSDSAMHRSCFLAWPEAGAFRAAFNQIWPTLVPRHPREMLDDGSIVERTGDEVRTEVLPKGLSIRLCVVEAVFQLTGRTGCVIAPGIPQGGRWRVKVGDPISIRVEGQSDIVTHVAGIEMLAPSSPKGIPIMLGPEVSKDMIPVGAQLWVAFQS
jgi:hypothetical protein